MDNISNAIAEKVLSDDLQSSEVKIKIKDASVNDVLDCPNLLDLHLVSVNQVKKSFIADIKCSNKTLHNIFGYYTIYCNAYSVSRNIKKNEVIYEEDVKKVTVLCNENHSYMLQLDDILERQASKDMNAGLVIKNEHLSNPIIVKQREVVDLIYESKNIKLKTKGLSMKQGFLNDRIKVKNLDTGNVVYGFISGKGVVRVD